MSTADVEAAFRDAQLFRALDVAAVKELIASGSSRALPAGADLVRQGDAAPFLFLVVEGRVKVSYLTPRSDCVTVRFKGPGELIGCAAVFRRALYPASVVAMTDAAVVGWPTAQALNWIEENPVLAQNALQVLSGQVEELLYRVSELASEPVETRLARAILRLMREYGKPIAVGRATIAFPATRQDLAELTGTTHFTVSRVLSRWAKERIVSRGRQRIVIRDADRLEGIADSAARAAQ
jgi:CRP-like cAMP-binding protein